MKIAGFGMTIVVLVMVPVIIHAQPITFPTSMETAEAQKILRAQYNRLETTDDPTGNGRELVDNRYLFNVIYGVDPRTALFINVPFHDRTWNDGNESFDASGIGDVELTVRRHWHKIQKPGYSFTSAPIFSVKVPTGSDTEDGFPYSKTLGSGSWDYGAGWVFRYARVGKPHYFGNAKFTVTTGASIEGTDYERGNKLEIDLARKAPLKAWETPRGELNEILSMLELNYEWEDKHEKNGSTLNGTGGSTLYATPGIVWARHNMIAEGAVQIPVVQNLRGDQVEDDFKIILGIWWNYF